MYMDKQVKRGYNEYIRLDEGIGKDAMMDVALLVMEDGDTWSLHSFPTRRSSDLDRKSVV